MTDPDDAPPAVENLSLLQGIVVRAEREPHREGVMLLYDDGRLVRITGEDYGGWARVHVQVEGPR